MPVERVNPPTLAPPVADVYSHVAVGTGTRFVAIAGQVATDANDNLVGPGDYALQAEQAFRNFKLALEAAGAGPDGLIKNTIHVVGFQPELVVPIFVAAQRVFEGHRPRSASTLLGVQSLGEAAWLIEVDGYAVLA
jgi:enamine deaminase RidA (YjgF/YER057c/UK114 family)